MLRPHTPDRPWSDEEGRTRGTTIRVQRTCNHCNRSLGDASQEELEAAVNGRLLPDTAEECGCHAHEFVKVRTGTWQGEPSYRQQCACGVVLSRYKRSAYERRPDPQPLASDAPIHPTTGTVPTAERYSMHEGDPYPLTDAERNAWRST